jgi:alkaline phosphatase
MSPWIQDAVQKGLGISDASNEEISLLVDHPEIAPYTFADMVSRRAQTGWTTHGHSGADVNIYASSPKYAKTLIGNHENTEIGDFLQRYLSIDVTPITEELKEKGPMYDTMDQDGRSVSWMGRLPEEGERLDGQDHLDHYSADFKKHKRCEICGL